MQAEDDKKIKQIKKNDSDLLYRAISLAKSEKEIKALFEDICTPAEITAMAGRLRAAIEIKAQKPYRQIYAETGVSVTTVGRIARCIEYGTGGYNLILDRLNRNE